MTNKPCNPREMTKVATWVLTVFVILCFGLSGISLSASGRTLRRHYQTSGVLQSQDKLSGPDTIKRGVKSNKCLIETDDYADVPSAAFPIQPISSTRGNFHVEGDVDCFEIVIPIDGELSVFTTGGVDTEGVLKSEHRNLAEDADSGVGENFLISKRLESGTYYVMVSGWNISPGGYTLVSEFAPNLSLTRHFSGVQTYLDQAVWAMNEYVRTRDRGSHPCNSASHDMLKRILDLAEKAFVKMGKNEGLLTRVRESLSIDYNVECEPKALFLMAVRARELGVEEVTKAFSDDWALLSDGVISGEEFAFSWAQDLPVIERQVAVAAALINVVRGFVEFNGDMPQLRADEAAQGYGGYASRRYASKSDDSDENNQSSMSNGGTDTNAGGDTHAQEDDPSYRSDSSDSNDDGDDDSAEGISSDKVITELSNIPRSAYEAGMSTKEVLVFAGNMQQLGAEDKLSDPQTWDGVKNGEADSILRETTREFLDVPHAVDSNASAEDLLSRMGVMQQVGADDKSNDARVWSDARKVLDSDMSIIDFNGKWGNASLEKNGSTGSNQSGSTGGQSNSDGGNSSKKEPPTNTARNGKEGRLDVDGGKYLSGRVADSKSGSGNTSEASSGSPASGSATGSSSGSTGGTSSGGNTSGQQKGNDGNSAQSPAVEDDAGGDSVGSATVIHNPDGSWTSEVTATDKNGNKVKVTQTFTQQEDGTWVDLESGDTSSSKPDPGTYPLSVDENGTVTVVTGENNSEGDSGDANGNENEKGESNNDNEENAEDSDSDSDSDDEQDDEDDDNDTDHDGDDDTEEDSGNDDDNGDDSSNDDNGSDEEATPVQPDYVPGYYPFSMSNEQFWNRSFTGEGRLVKLSRYILTTGDRDSDETQRDPAPPHLGGPDPTPPDDDSGTMSRSSTKIAPQPPPREGPDPVPETAGTTSNDVHWQSSGGFTTVSGGIGSSMGPIEPWKCRRRLINGFCYCPLHRNPQTGAPIRQWIQVPTRLEEDGIVEDKLGWCGEPECMDCREYTDAEWESMWPDFY